MLKRGCHGTYPQESPRHLQRYVAAFAGRNVWRMDTRNQLGDVAEDMEGKTLCFKNPIKKTEMPA